MTPKEKAKQLVDSCFEILENNLTNDDVIHGGFISAKQCAQICADEMIEAWSNKSAYWNQVKKEIENI